MESKEEEMERKIQFDSSTLRGGHLKGFEKALLCKMME
jgi:hypothetical protein